MSKKRFGALEKNAQDNKQLPDLKKEAERTKEENTIFDLEREDSLKEHKHLVLKFFIWVLAVLATIIFLVRILHLVLPPHCHWLTTTQVQSLDKFLFSGTVGSLLGKNSKKIFGK